MFTTDLGLAAYNGERHKIQEALKTGINWKDEAEYLLSSAIFGQQWDIARDILKGGMPISDSVYKEIYHWADPSLLEALPPRPDILEELQLQSQKYDFFNAIIDGHVEDAKKLFLPEWIHATTDILADRVSRQPLHLAARGCHFELIQFFLKNGAQANSLSSDGQSALYLISRCPSAEKHLRRQCFQLLKSHGGEMIPPANGWLENWRLSRGGWRSN